MTTTRPDSSEYAGYYAKYIDRVPDGDIVAILESQLETTATLLGGISDERSLHRYAPEKWSIRQVVSHLSDSERVFGFRAFWFARGFDSALPSYDQETGVTGAADEVPWAHHLAELTDLRRTTLALFRHLPAEAWSRRGIASDNPVSVRALAYILAGHVDHHTAILKERYL